LATACLSSRLRRPRAGGRRTRRAVAAGADSLPRAPTARPRGVGTVTTPGPRTVAQYEDQAAYGQPRRSCKTAARRPPIARTGELRTCYPARARPRRVPSSPGYGRPGLTRRNGQRRAVTSGREFGVASSITGGTPSLGSERTAVRGSYKETAKASRSVAAAEGPALAGFRGINRRRDAHRNALETAMFGRQSRPRRVHGGKWGGRPRFSGRFPLDQRLRGTEARAARAPGREGGPLQGAGAVVRGRRPPVPEADRVRGGFLRASSQFLWEQQGYAQPAVRIRRPSRKAASRNTGRRRADAGTQGRHSGQKPRTAVTPPGTADTGRPATRPAGKRLRCSMEPGG